VDSTTVTRTSRRRARELVRTATRTFPASDLALWAAGATFFGILGLVPLALVALWAAAALVGPDQVVAGMDTAVSGLPAGHGTADALRTLTRTAVAMSWLQALIALFPASIYGEGLRRAFLQLSPEQDRFTGWRGRLGLLVLAVAAPVLVLALLAAGPVVAPLYSAGGGRLLLGIVIAFHVVWVLVSTALVLIFQFVAAGRIGRAALFVGGFGTGAVLSGFLQGFLLFLAIPVDWSAPFGGLPGFGAVAALVFWLYLLHLVVLVGFRVTLVIAGERSSLDDRSG
jgi:membrane protein